MYHLNKFIVFLFYLRWQATMALHLSSCPWNGCLPVQAKAPTAGKEKPFQQRWTFEGNHSTVWPPSWTKLLYHYSQVTLRHCPRSQCLLSSFQAIPTRDKVASKTRRTHDAKNFGVHFESRVLRVPRVRVILPDPSILPKPQAARSAGVTMVLVFLAKTIAFYLNKFIILCAYRVLLWSDCTGPDERQNAIVKNYVEMHCSSSAGALDPRAKETCEKMNISLLFPSFATVALSHSFKSDLYWPNHIWLSIWLHYENLASN